jgi:rubrerythrin
MITQTNSGPGDVWTVPETMLPLASAPEPRSRSPLERLQEAVAAHIGAETNTVTAYRGLANMAEDPVVALLMQLVVDDETRHHGLLDRMAARLKTTLEWITVPGALPTGLESIGAPSPELVAALEAYVRQEEEGAGQLRRIAAEEADMYGGLFALLLETMAMDSEKHAHILRYLLRRALRRMEK